MLAAELAYRNQRETPITHLERCAAAYMALTSVLGQTHSPRCRRGMTQPCVRPVTLRLVKTCIDGEITGSYLNGGVADGQDGN